MLQIILAALPILGNLIPKGKTADIVAAGTKVAQEMFGTADEQTVMAKLESDPALAEQFKAKLAAETSALQATLADVQDARATTVALSSQGGWNANATAILTAINYIGFFGILTLLVLKGLPDNARELVAGMIGAIVGAYVGTNNFWFGSSAGSANKDSLIRNISSENTTTAAKVAAKVVEAAKR